jgi:alpha-mannosidase
MAQPGQISMQYTVHLVCNAHIDPVWLWSWEEGLAETLSTFRIAAGFCEQFDNFIFCHNESLLYKWVEEFDPVLFRKIQRLVSLGKWKIIGGWYVQPDCNLPSGESFVRQILIGKKYFKDKFGVEPETAANFDPFGHSRGLVQILAKSGFSSYLFCRPDSKYLDLPADDFVWEGFDGSTVLAHRASEHYNSEKGKVDKKLDTWAKQNLSAEQALFLWGIGNHGGGPSLDDLVLLQARISKDVVNPQMADWDVLHSDPEAYFNWLKSKKSDLVVVESDLNPWAVGCYTSMSRVKKMHREMEEVYYLTEKMVSHAVIAGLMKYPNLELREALEDMLFCEFHDILPGSGIPEVESYALQRMSHGLEILSRLKAKAFFNLLTGHAPAHSEEFPILVYNPEPYEVSETLIVELQGAEPNFDPEIFLLPELFDQVGDNLEYQLEKESANIANDHRKRLVFRAKLAASSMNRFSCYLKKVSIIEKPSSPVQDDLVFINETCEIHINRDSGLIDQYKVNGFDFLKPDSAELLVMEDYADPWGMKVNSFRDLAGAFRLMSPSETVRFAGTNGPIQPIRIIENGPIRVVVEGLFRHNGSSAAVRYIIPKIGSEIEIEVRVMWNERDRMLKMAFPVSLSNSECMGQVAYGTQEFSRPGEELIAHKWVGLFSRTEDKAFTISNQTTYGFDYSDGTIRVSLLRSPAYAGHPVDDFTPIVRQDRFTPRMDIGEHVFRFRFNAGVLRNRLESVDQESRLLNCPSMCLCCFPKKTKKKVSSLINLTNPTIRLAAIKFAESDDRVIVRLFEPTGNPARTEVIFPILGLNADLVFKPFEIKTLAIDRAGLQISEVNLLES